LIICQGVHLCQGWQNARNRSRRKPPLAMVSPTIACSHFRAVLCRRNIGRETSRDFCSGSGSTSQGAPRRRQPGDARRPRAAEARRRKPDGVSNIDYIRSTLSKNPPSPAPSSSRPAASNATARLAVVARGICVRANSDGRSIKFLTLYDPCSRPTSGSNQLDLLELSIEIGQYFLGLALCQWLGHIHAHIKTELRETGAFPR